MKYKIINTTIHHTSTDEYFIQHEKKVNSFLKKMQKNKKVIVKTNSHLFQSEHGRPTMTSEYYYDDDGSRRILFEKM